MEHDDDDVPSKTTQFSFTDHEIQFLTAALNYFGANLDEFNDWASEVGETMYSEVFVEWMQKKLHPETKGE